MTQTQLAQTVRIAAANGQSAPIFVAGNSLPARWQQSLATRQSNLELHLQFGDSNLAAENITLGRWRISGIPATTLNAQNVDLEILVNQDGAIKMRATCEGSPLTISPMGDSQPKAPIQSASSLSLDGDLPQPENDNQPILLLDEATKLDQLIQQIRSEGAGSLNETTLAQLREHGFDTGSIKMPPKKGSLFQTFFGRKKKPPTRELSPEEIVRLAGEPLRPDERQRCPHCEAVISRNAKKCEWCGETL